MASIITGMQLDSNLGRSLISAEREVNTLRNNLVNLQNSVSMGFNCNSVQRFQQEVQGTNMALQQVSNSVERLQHGSNSVSKIWEKVCKIAESINSNTEAQKRFNKELEDGEKCSKKLENAIKGIATKYLSFQSISKVLGMSDNMINMSAKVNVVNDGQLSTQELTDAIYVSAQRAYVSFLEVTDAVAVLGNTVAQEFGSSMQIVAFLEQANKQMALGGADAQQQSNAITQLTMAMQEGVLQGSRLNAVLAVAPGIGEAIEQSMGWAEGSLKSYAEQGLVTAQVVKNSLLGMSEETNERFADMPTTFSQAAQNLQNGALRAFQPILQHISNIFNSQQFASFVQGVIEVFAVASNMLLNLINLAGTIGNFFNENLSVIAPLILGIVAAFLVYKAAILATAIASKVASVAVGVWSVVQKAFNAIMAMNPVLLTVIAVILLIAVIYSVCAAIAKATGVAQSGFGVFCGAVGVVIAALENFRLFVLNVFIGIGSAVLALKYNIVAAFVNVAARLQSIWNSILATVLTVIADILDAISNLPFIGMDYSGLSAGIRKEAEFSEEIAENLKNIEMEYEDPLEAFKEGFSTFEAFEDGWQKEAFEKGAAWGDGVAEKVSDVISGFSLSNIFGAIDMPGMDDYQYLHDQEELFDNVGIIADNTSDISDSVSVSQEDLSYLRDLATQEAVNRFTTASINVEMNTHNNISREADLDGIVDGLTGKVLEAMELVQEGV